MALTAIAPASICDKIIQVTPRAQASINQAFVAAYITKLQYYDNMYNVGKEGRLEAAVLQLLQA